MSDRLTMFLGALLLPLLAIGQAASEVPVPSVSTALPGSPTWSATAPFNTLVTRDIDPITGQLGAAVPRNFTHNISAFGSGGANQYAEPVGSYTHSLTPANSDITVVGTFSLGRHYRIDFTIPEQAFPTAMGAEATYTIEVTFTHSPAGQSITHTDRVGSITLRNGAANNSGNAPTPPTPTPPTPAPPTPNTYSGTPYYSDTFASLNTKTKCNCWLVTLAIWISKETSRRRPWFQCRCLTTGRFYKTGIRSAECFESGYAPFNPPRENP